MKIKILFIILLIPLLILVLVVTSVINEVDVGRAMSYTPHGGETRQVQFEKDALVHKDEFLNFLTFSENKRYIDLILKKTTPNKNLLKINETFKIEEMRRNDCFELRCLQFKINFGQIPLVLTKGLIGVEDYRFLDHNGVDFISILRAIYYDIKAGKLVQGGSTLTQQLAKNLFFTNEKSFSRKFKEIILSIYIEIKYEKSEILQTYFNEVFWGSVGSIQVKGVEAAALVYFNKRAIDLEPFESSILVSMLKGPNLYNPIRNIQKLRMRSELIFKKLIEQKSFNNDKLKLWSDENWDRWRKELLLKIGKQQIETVYTLTKENTNRTFVKYKIINSSLNLINDKKEISNKLAVKIKTSIGDGFTFYTSIERNKEIAMTKEYHQIGSTIKPLIYYLLKSFGVTLDKVVKLEEINLDLLSGQWSPRESHEIPEKEITLRRALQESFNRPVIKEVYDVGFDSFEKEIEKFIPRLKLPLKEYPSQLLGSVELSVDELFNIYKKVIALDCQTDGSVVEALSDPSLTTIRKMASPIMGNQVFFGKTGTTNNGFDSWFIGHDGNNLFVIWTGVDGRRDVDEKLPLYGSNTSFKIFEEIVLYSGKRMGFAVCR